MKTNVEDCLWIGFALWLSLTTTTTTTTTNTNVNANVNADADARFSLDWPSVASLVCALWTTVQNNTNNDGKGSQNGDNDHDSDNNKYSKFTKTRNKTKNGFIGRPSADSGAVMSMVLIPACLVGDYQKYASLMVLLSHELLLLPLLPLPRRQCGSSSWLLRLLWVMASIIMIIIMITTLSHTVHFGFDDNDSNYRYSLLGMESLSLSLLFIILWWALAIYFKPILETSLTCGEFRILISMATVCLLEWIIQTYTMIAQQDQDQQQSTPTSSLSSSYATVALSGVIGCAASLLLTSQIKQKLCTSSSSSFSILVQILLNGAGPLIMVEMGLWLAADISYSDDNDDNALNNIPLLPLWSRWLLQFLQSPEPTFHDDNDNDDNNNNNNNNDGTIWPSSLLPRYFGVLYWFIVVVLTSIPTLRIVEHQAVVVVDAVVVVVVRRKWFHLIAVLLFGPITWIFPQLMALGYAIALCGLAILESLRKTPQLPALHTFYKALIDPHKDNVNTIVFSHMFLILGCAVPLWMKMMMKTTTTTMMTTGKDEDSNNNNDLLLLLLLSQWGVLSLGVGDAMGALVGTYFGKHRWGRNRRTIEGSAAMWTSMMIIGGMVLSCSSSSSSSLPLSSSLWSALLVATTFTTWLEAYTLQMDNFILPLAGAVILLRFQK